MFEEHQLRSASQKAEKIRAIELDLEKKYDALRPWEYTSSRGKDVFVQYFGGKYLTTDIAQIIYEMGVGDVYSAIEELNLETLHYDDIIQILETLDLEISRSEYYSIDASEFEREHHGYTWYTVSDAEEEIEKMKQQRASDGNLDRLRDALKDAYIHDTDRFDVMAQVIRSVND